MSKDTGGSAFPQTHVLPSLDGSSPGWMGYEGMTLRDYFAAKAMQGYIASYSGPDVCSPDHDLTAAQAYGYADAMLKARE
jgi:hypothetical protein